MSIDKLKTKFSTGAFVADVKHYFSKINEIIDYLNGNPIVPYDPGYKVFSAVISQDTTTAPTIDGIQENNLGYTPTFSRTNVGYYSMIFPNFTFAPDGVSLPLKGRVIIDSSSAYGFGLIYATVDSHFSISIHTTASIGGASSDTILYGTPITVYVYD